MGFQESNAHDYTLASFPLPRPSTHHSYSKHAPATSNKPTAGYMEDGRESSTSPLPVSDEGSTSPGPSAGDSGTEGISEISPSNEHGQPNPGAKVQSLRQRTAQACDKCRERKTKCSGHRPVCTRCTNRGLICEYSVRESRIRSMMKTRPIPSPNPFQVNYPSSGGRPTPAYHSRMGQSQTNAYDRSPNSYDILTSNAPLVPPALSPYKPPSSSGLSDQIRYCGLIIPRSEHGDRYPAKRDTVRARKSSQWEMSPSHSQSSMNSSFDRQRAVDNSPYAMGLRQDSPEKDFHYTYDLMGRNFPADHSPNSSAYVNPSNERTSLVGGTPNIPLPDLSYHQFLTQVNDQLSVHDILLTMLDSLEQGVEDPVSTPPASLRYTSGISDLYQYAKDFLPPNYDNTAGYPAWQPGDGSLLPTLEEAAAAPALGPEYGSAAYAGHSDKHLPPAMRAFSAPATSPIAQLEFMWPTPGLPISAGANGGHGGGERAPYAGHGGGFPHPSVFGLADDTPPGQRGYIPPVPVPDPGTRFGEYGFFK